MTALVFAAQKWKNNSELVAACAQLGYLHKDRLTLDPTYNRGLWWKKFRPDGLVIHDRDIDGVDFRHLPEDDDTFEQIGFDPPYVASGSRDKTTVPDFFDRYGMDDAPRTPAGVQQQINDGLTEMLRVAAPKGIVLAKSQDYISSGKLWLGSHHTLTHALDIGFKVVDRLEHIGGSRPQPKGRTRLDKKTGKRIPTVQQHARRNLSTLLVLQAPGRRRKAKARVTPSVAVDQKVAA